MAQMTQEQLAEFARRNVELDKRVAELNAREARLVAREEVQKKRLRENLYDKIPLKVRTMDIVIGVLVVLLVAAIAVGIALGG